MLTAAQVRGVILSPRYIVNDILRSNGAYGNLDIDTPRSNDAYSSLDSDTERNRENIKEGIHTGNDTEDIEVSHYTSWVEIDTE